MKKNYITITRKYALIPTYSDKKEWEQKVRNYTIQDLEQKISYANKRLSKKKDAANQNKLENYENTLADFQENPEITQAIVNNYTYGLVRTAMEEEARRKNYILSWIYSEMVAAGVQYMDNLNDKYTFINQKIRYAYRQKGSKKGSLFDNLPPHTRDFSHELGGISCICVIHIV